MDGSMLEAPELFRLREDVAETKGRNPGPDRNSTSWLTASSESAAAGASTVVGETVWKRS